MRSRKPLEQDTIYHIYTRGNNREDLFREERNYAYFMSLYHCHIDPIAETYAYCLLKNHLHVLVKIKPQTNQGTSPSRIFANLFTAYAKAINKAYGRVGALFGRPFGRSVVGSDRYFQNLVAYIHLNPQRHGLVSAFGEWPYSSYDELRLSTPTTLDRITVHQQFGGLNNFLAAHTILKQPEQAKFATFVEDIEQMELATG